MNVLTVQSGRALWDNRTTVRQTPQLAGNPIGEAIANCPRAYAFMQDDIAGKRNP